MKKLLSAVLTACTVYFAATAWGETVQGQISLPEPVDQAGSVNLYGKYNKPAKKPELAVGVVALYSEGAAGRRPSGEAPVMDQKDLQFDPNVLPIQLGTKVLFTNSDSYYHNVFSLSQVKKFDLGRYPNGDMKAVVFDQPGVVPVFCDIHADMQAYIVVVETPYFAKTDASGNYTIENVPPGEYEVWAWRPGDTAVKRHSKITVVPQRRSPEVR